MSTNKEYNFSRKNTNIYYVYLHRKASTKEVFYVGKGFGRRAYVKTNRNRFWHNIVDKHGLIVEIVQNYIPEWLAFELEKYLINYYRSVKTQLANLSDGGEGPSGLTHSEKTKRKMSERRKGNTYSAKKANVYMYSSNELVASSVILKHWAVNNNLSQGSLCQTAYADRTLPSSAGNRHHYKGYYVKYIS